MLVDAFFCFQMSCSVCRALSWDETPIPGILFHYPIKLCSAEIIHYKNSKLNLSPSFFWVKFNKLP